MENIKIGLTNLFYIREVLGVQSLLLPRDSLSELLQADDGFSSSVESKVNSKSSIEAAESSKKLALQIYGDVSTEAEKNLLEKMLAAIDIKDYQIFSGDKVNELLQVPYLVLSEDPVKPTSEFAHYVPTPKDILKDSSLKKQAWETLKILQKKWMK